MPSRVVRSRPGPSPAVAEPGSLARRFAAIREQLHVPDGFPAEVLAEADQAVAAAVDGGSAEGAEDLRELGFWTLDPVGSMDLDQAMLLERSGAGYRVRYAIADVPAFVVPGGAIDLEARRRGQTIYLPDDRAPLHPPTLSEGAASLLPGQLRPAYVWEFELDADAVPTSSRVRRALVRSVARRDYGQVQGTVDSETPDEQVVLLREIGRKRQALEQQRGGASLPMPEQQVVHDGAGRYRLEYRPPVEAEDWNAQISLLTGMAAAQLMLTGGVGVLRTMPAPQQDSVRRFRRQAKALGVPWPNGQRYGDFLRSLQRTDPRHLALIHEATSLFRGAGYTSFDGALPEAREHAAVAAPYAHVTAPLRRLVDRFGLVVCAALSAGQPVPEWARTALGQLPALMSEGDRRAGAVERACTDAVEAAVLVSQVGADFAAVVVDRTSRQVPIVQLSDPAVLAPAEGHGEPGDSVTVTVRGADVAAGRVDLVIRAGPPAAQA
jgi:exoribonuclease R